MAKKNGRPTAADCIKDIRKIQLSLHGENSNKAVSRDKYYKYSDMPTAWKKHFGTFAEFKKEAGVNPEKSPETQVAQVGRDIAKHAKVDKYRPLAERKNWGKKYIRENGNRYKQILAIADVHDVEVDPFWLRVMLDTAKRTQPDVICIDGDLFDLTEFGRFYVDAREYRLTERLQFVHDKVLGPLRKACPDSQIDLIEGNHEARLLKHLCNNSDQMREFLSDWLEIDIAGALKLNEHKINYVAEADLTAWTKKDLNAEISSKNFRIYYDCVLAHHFPSGRDMGYPGFSAHHHKHEMWTGYSPHFGPYEWHQLGAGHMRSADYADGLKWNNGFGLVHVDTKTLVSNMEYVPVTDMACVGGQYYHREKKETVLPGRK